MDITRMVTTASVALVLFAFLKYGFMFLWNILMLNQEKAVVHKVLGLYGKEIADKIAETVSQRITFVSEATYDNRKPTGIK